MGRLVKVSLDRQQLQLLDDERLLMETAISTAANGPGEMNGSGCTPRGWHIVRAKIGAGCPENSVFRGRRPTGEIYTATLGQAEPGRDWILSRILWLSGIEPGRNRMGMLDTMRRYIYIHGAPDEEPMGVALSHGCVRMRNRDIIRLFELVKTGTRVLIEE